uniref:Leucine-rich PPR motif-containing protein, mitochondrial n=1 Tax=Elaeophora elaphi TaxID=1147741 RepID=A0A158Q792_9BILA
MFVAARAWAATSLCKKRITESTRKLTTVSTNQNIGESSVLKIFTNKFLFLEKNRPYDSKWPSYSLDKTQHSQMSYLESSLFKKHIKHLQVDQQKNIYDVIDSIEWSYLVTEAHLEKALNMLTDLKCNDKLADSEIALLISSTGCRCQMLSASQRNEYTNRLLQAFKIRGVVLGIASRNALLAAQIDNEVDVSVVETLKQFESDGLVPDAQTYGQLSRIYARKANLKGIMEIINHGKNVGIELPSQVLESMVYSMVSLGQDEKAMSVIEHVSSNISLADSLKMAYTLAKAEHFDSGNILESLDKIGNVSTFIEKHQISIYELLFSLARKGNLDAVVKLKSILPSLFEGIDKQCESVIYGRIRRFLNKEEESIAAAAILLDLVPNNEKRSKFQSILMKEFLSTIQKKKIAEAVKVCTVFQKCNVLKHSLRILLHDMALKNPKNFHNVFAIYKQTDAFIELQNRPHLHLPVAVLHFNELMEADTVEKKVEHLLDIVRSLRSTGIASCGDRYFANVKDLFIVPLLKDRNALPQLMKKIENDSSLQCFVVDVLITHLLATKQMQQLQLLLTGALKNSSAGEAFPYREVKNLILDTSVYNESLAPTCSLLRLLFPLPGVYSNRHYGKGMQIIKTAIVAGDLNKVKLMCELWSADKRIVLRKVDKDDLLQTLDRNGEKWKKRFVAKLSEMVKLNEVATVHGVKQKPLRKVDNENQKRVEAEMQSALDCGDLEKAKEIWVAGSEHASASKGLLLAEKLYFSKMMDQFKFVLLKLKEQHEDLSYHVLTAYDSSDISGEQMVFLNETCRVLDLPLDVKQELLHNTRVNAFHKLIEKGNLNHALDSLKIISAQKNSVFGQFDLMGAAIERDDTAIIYEVLNLITTYHGKESSLADFCVALLERNKKAHAMRLVQSSGFQLSAAKLNYYIDREIDLNRVEVILDLLELCVPKRNLEQRDLESAVSKIIAFYVKRKNDVVINVIEKRLKGIGIRLTPKIDSLLLKSKEQNFGVVCGRNEIKVTVMARNLIKFNQISKISLPFQCSVLADVRYTFAIRFERTLASQTSSSGMTRVRWRKHNWNVDHVVKDAFNDIMKGSRSFTTTETQRAIKHFNDLTTKGKIPDYMAVKIASVATVHLGWEEGEKILKMHYMSHGAELRFAGEASVMDEQVEGAVRRIFDNMGGDGYKVAHQFYCRLIDLKFCKVKDCVSRIFIQDLLKK